MAESPREPDEAIDEVLAEAERCLAALRGMALGRRIVEISQEMFAAEQAGNLELMSLLMNEQLQLARLKMELERSNVPDWCQQTNIYKKIKFIWKTIFTTPEIKI